MQERDERPTPPSDTASPASNPQEDWRSIAAAVEGVGALGRRRLGAEGFLWALAALGGFVALGAALFAVAAPAWWLRLLWGVAWGAALGGALWWRCWRPARPLRDAQELARRVEQRFSELRNDVTASLQLGRELDEVRAQGRVSAAMIERLLAQTQRHLAGLGSRVLEAAPAARPKQPLAAAAVALVLLVAMGLAAPEATSRGLRGLFLGPDAEAQATMDVPGKTRAPILGDLTVRLQHPDYTGLGERVIENSTGELEALKGTQIELSGLALKPVKKAELVLKTQIEAAPAPDGSAPAEPAGPQRVLLQRRPGGKLVGSLTALRGGTWTLEATLEDGTEVYDGIERTLTVVPDEDPRIEVARPQGEVEVAPQDVVTFAWSASDDFGLREIAVVAAFAGDEKNKKRIVIQGSDAQAPALPGDARPEEGDEGGDTRAMGGEYALALDEFKLQAKDQLVVYLEAVDNDTISGPKVATSAPVVLKVSSPEDKHLELIEEQQKLFEALLGVLGDYLENPVGATYTDPAGKPQEGVPPEWTAAELGQRFAAAIPPHEKAGEVQGSMKALLERMEQDPLLLRRDFELYKKTYEELARLQSQEGVQLDSLRPVAKQEKLSRAQLQNLFSSRAETIHGTERAIITLEDLVASQRMENLLETAKDLQAAKDRLKELMQKYKETKDPALRQEIMRQLQRLRERMKEIAQKMSQQAQDLPTEHVNLEALEPKEMAKKAEDVSSSMDKLMEALEKGDIDQAMAMLEKMDQDVDSMLSDMESEFAEMQPSGLSELDKQVSELMDEINDIEAQQKEVTKNTDELAREMEQQRNEQMQGQIEAFKEQARQKLDEIKRELGQVDTQKLREWERENVDRAKQRAKQLEQAIEQGDLGQASELASELENELQRSGTDLEFGERGTLPNDPRRQAYKQGRQSVQRAQPKAQELSQELGQLMEQANRPQPTEGQGQRMSELGQQQGQARQRTKGLQEKLEKSGQQFPMLKDALQPGLEEAGQFMEDAQERLGQGQGRKAHENEKLALDKLGGLKEQLKQALQKQRMGEGEGGKRVSNEPVKIPGRDDTAPKEFRQDIMDAMKEGGLDDYSEELKRYYESLVR